MIADTYQFTSSINHTVNVNIPSATACRQFDVTETVHPFAVGAKRVEDECDVSLSVHV